MRGITRKILELELFKAPEENIDVSESNHWDDGDQITILESESALLALRISNLGEDSDTYSVSLEVDQLDVYGDVFLNDSIWSLYGNEDEIFKENQTQNWDLNNLGSYSYLFKSS